MLGRRQQQLSINTVGAPRNKLQFGVQAQSRILSVLTRITGVVSEMMVSDFSRLKSNRFQFFLFHICIAYRESPSHVALYRSAATEAYYHTRQLPTNVSEQWRAPLNRFVFFPYGRMHFHGVRGHFNIFMLAFLLFYYDTKEKRRLLTKLEFADCWNVLPLVFLMPLHAPERTRFLIGFRRQQFLFLT